MASKTATANGEERPAQIKRQEPSAVANLSGNVVGVWEKFTGFLSDVRAETRKVVTPSRKEVQATTSVVLITVFLFGVFFMVTDFVFNRVISQILHRLGGAQ
jgi:preprotein translocase subunit SecE